MNRKLRLNGTAAAGLAVGLVGLSSCMYFQKQAERSPSPDQRIHLGVQDRLLLYSREIPDYTCDTKYFLMCTRGGSTKYSCTCVLR